MDEIAFKKYYSDRRVLFRISQYLNKREGTFMNDNKCFRCIKAFHSDYLKMNFSAFDFFLYPQNIYYSLAHIPALPMFSFNMTKRKIEQNEFNSHFSDYVTGYDMGLDFDSHIFDIKTGQMTEYPFKDLKNDVCRIKKVLDNNKVSYSLKTSGSGFHINIPSYIVWHKNLKETIDRINNAVQNIKIIYNLTSLDITSNAERKIWKCPYSYDIKTGRIALPLSDDEFKNFSFNQCESQFVIDNWGDYLSIGSKNRDGTQRDGQDFMRMILNE